MSDFTCKHPELMKSFAKVAGVGMAVVCAVGVAAGLVAGSPVGLLSALGIAYMGPQAVAEIYNARFEAFNARFETFESRAALQSCARMQFMLAADHARHSERMKEMEVTRVALRQATDRLLLRA